MRNRSKHERLVTVKIMIVGDTSSGKEHLKQTYLQRPGESEEYSVVFLEDLLYDQTVKVEIYEPKAESIDSRLNRVLEKEVNGVIVVYDSKITSTFDRLPKILGDRIHWSDDSIFELVNLSRSDDSEEEVKAISVQEWLESEEYRTFGMDYKAVDISSSLEVLTLFHSIIRKCVTTNSNLDDSDLGSGLLSASPLKKKKGRNENNNDNENQGGKAGCTIL